MAKVIIVASLVFASGKLIAEAWSTIERPFLEFIMLGIIPGTSFQLSFEHILLIGLTAFLAFWLVEHRGALKRLARSIDLSSL